MRAGRAQVLSLIGEPGAGKSRLQREFFARLEADGRLEGTTIRRAACSALGEQTYGTAAALLRDAYGVEHGDSVEVARSKLAAGLETLGVDAEDRAAMAAALARVLGLERTTRACATWSRSSSSARSSWRPAPWWSGGSPPARWCCSSRTCTGPTPPPSSCSARSRTGSPIVRSWSS